ncbi:MAG TPA: sigma-54 dependent transcriptional regulator [Polyangia bacterium]
MAAPARPSRRLLVIDDDEAGCRLVRAIFAAEGFEVLAAHDGPSGLEKAAAERPELVIVDLQLPGLDGLEVLQRLKDRHPELPVVMLTAHGEVKTAVRATQLGAFDYLTKPVDADELALAVRRALELRALQVEVETLRRQVGDEGGLAAQMGPSAAIASVVEQVRTVAATSFSVLVVGETGTGKELVAQAVHKQSERRARPFVALDCGAIPEALLESELFGHERGAFTGAERRRAGQFHLAEGGSLFLDEIGNLPMSLQAKLLRVLESRQVQSVGAGRATPIDVRFIAATNDDLQARVTAGQFRADLYFRLAQYTIALPPLRERRDDLPALALRFLREVSVELRRPVQGIAPEALALLEKHPWPGNVRELRNAVRQAVLHSKEAIVQRGAFQKVLGKSAPASARAAGAAGASLKEVADRAAREAERDAIAEALRVTRGNKSQAARALRTDFKTLHLKMKSLGLKARDFA